MRLIGREIFFCSLQEIFFAVFFVNNLVYYPILSGLLAFEPDQTNSILFCAWLFAYANSALRAFQRPSAARQGFQNQGGGLRPLLLKEDMQSILCCGILAPSERRMTVLPDQALRHLMGDLVSIVMPVCHQASTVTHEDNYHGLPPSCPVGPVNRLSSEPVFIDQFVIPSHHVFFTVEPFGFFYPHSCYLFFVIYVPHNFISFLFVPPPEEQGSLRPRALVQCYTDEAVLVGSVPKDFATVDVCLTIRMLRFLPSVNPNDVLSEYNVGISVLHWATVLSVRRLSPVDGAKDSTHFSPCQPFFANFLKKIFCLLAQWGQRFPGTVGIFFITPCSGTYYAHYICVRKSGCHAFRRPSAARQPGIGWKKILG